MDQFYGLLLYIISLFSVGAIYGILCLGLNLQWGVTGIFNTGIGAFVALGGYSSAIVTTELSSRHLGGFGLPLWVGILQGMILSAIFAYLIARLCIRLRSDYLAIATLGISEIIRLVLKNESWATNGARGIGKVPKPFSDYSDLGEIWYPFLVMLLFWMIMIFCYICLENLRLAPWGRVMSAIRDNEVSASSLGKDVDKFRIEAFVVGSVLMGLAGSLLVHYLSYIGPNVTDPVSTTFLVWVMLIIGGSGSNKGAILGAMVVWFVWSASELLTIRLPEDWAIRAAYLRVFLIGLVLQFMIQKFPGGMLGEKRLES